MKKITFMLLYLIPAVLFAQSKNMFTVRPGFSFPIGDFNELANPTYNVQVDWQHYFNEKAAFGIGFLSGGNKFDATAAANNVLSNVPGATLATVAAQNYKYTALYGMATYNFTSTHKLAVEFTTRLGVAFSKQPAVSVYAADAFSDYVDVEESSSSATSFYYTGALVLRYPISDRFDISLSNEYVKFSANYNISGIDYLAAGTYTTKTKQNYSLIFTSIGLNWKFSK